MFRLTGLGLLVLFLPVVFLGIGFPAIMAWAEQERTQTSSRTLGRVLAVNVVGSILGALAAGFVLPSSFGLWNSILLLAALLVLAGARALPQQRVLLWLGLFLLLGALLAGHFGPLPRVRLSSGERLLDVSEGSHGVVAVVEKSGSRRLKLNNFYVLGGTSSTGDERMQAHLPLLLHPSPKKVAVLGLGTGITASGALVSPGGEHHRYRAGSGGCACRTQTFLTGKRKLCRGQSCENPRGRRPQFPARDTRKVRRHHR
jgi:spermidine synthase